MSMWLVDNNSVSGVGTHQLSCREVVGRSCRDIEAGSLGDGFNYDENMIMMG